MRLPTVRSRRLPILCLLAAAASVLSSTTAALVPAPVLEADERRYLGALTAGDTVEQFLGVPFAAPPTGERRWRPPQPLESGPGKAHARSFAPACLQGGYMADWYADLAAGFGAPDDAVTAPPESEDCLYLNVWRPRERGGAPLPVLVFIHGGANAGGWAWEPNYHGARLAAQGLVVVTVAYRVGVFGFFSHPESEPANFGLLDQVAALAWIRDHAAALGADPDRVTVMGESSGGNNIIHLMVAPQAEGLFQRAIVQSAGWALQGARRKAGEEALALDLQKALLGDGGNLEALRAVPGEELFAAARTAYASHFFDPVIDGHSLLEPVAEAVAGGRFAPVDLVIGSNADEWRMYLAEDATLDDWADEGLPPDLRAAAEPLLAPVSDPRHALDRAVTAHQMVCPSLFLAEAVHRAGGRAWTYWFTRQRPGDRAAAMGAYHGAELPYLFDTHDAWLPTAPEDRDLTRLMMSYWARFAGTGDPNGTTPGAAGQSPPWPPYAGGGEDVLRLDTDPRPVHHPEWPLCAVLGVNPQAGATIADHGPE